MFLGLAVLLLAGSWVHHRWFFSARQRLRRDLGDAAGLVRSPRPARDQRAPPRSLAEAERFWGSVPAAAMTVEQAGWSLGELISGRWTTALAPDAGRPTPARSLVVGPQGSRKSQYLIPMILDAPGPAVVTSTKTELINATGAVARRRRSARCTSSTR